MLGSQGSEFQNGRFASAAEERETWIMQRTGESECMRACVGVCVCVSHPVSNDLKLQGDWSRFAYSVQRSFGISVDEWSDQPLAPANFKSFPHVSPLCSNMLFDPALLTVVSSQVLSNHVEG